jgi:hypothetical protein
MLLDEEAVSQDVVESMLQWPHSGFDAFTGQEIPGHDTESLENLAQYISKGPVSLQNLEYSDENHEACYRSEKIHPRHGQYRSFDPLEFLAELTTHIAQPYEKLTKTHGYYSNRSRGRRENEQKVSERMHSTLNSCRNKVSVTSLCFSSSWTAAQSGRGRILDFAAVPNGRSSSSGSSSPTSFGMGQDKPVSFVRNR